MAYFRLALLILVPAALAPTLMCELLSKSVYSKEDSSDALLTFKSHYPPRQDKGDIPKSQKDVVNILRRDNYIKSDIVANIMLQVDLKKYEKLYLDVPKFFGMNVVCSEQHYTAYSLEMYKNRLKPGGRVLVTEFNSGYIGVCMALMVGPKGFVVGLEDYRPCFEASTMNINTSYPNLLQEKRIKMIMGNASIGAPEFAPYDVIHVGLLHLGLIPQAANAVEILLNQLKKGGRMLVPFRNKLGVHRMAVYDKDLRGKVTRFIDPGVFEILDLELNKHHFEETRRELIDPEDPPQLEN